MEMTKTQIDIATRFFETPKVDNGNPVVGDLVKTGIPYFTAIEKIAQTNGQSPEVIHALNEAKTALTESFLWAQRALGYVLKGSVGNNA